MEVIEKQIELVEILRDKFEPERLLVMQILPILNQPKKTDRNGAYPYYTF